MSASAAVKAAARHSLEPGRTEAESRAECERLGVDFTAVAFEALNIHTARASSN